MNNQQAKPGPLHPPPSSTTKHPYSNSNNNKSMNYYVQNPANNNNNNKFKKKFANYNNFNGGYNNHQNNGYKNYGNQGYLKNKSKYFLNLVLFVVAFSNFLFFISLSTVFDMLGYYNNRYTNFNNPNVAEVKCNDSVGNSSSNPVSPPTASSNSNSSNATESPPSKVGSLNNLDYNTNEGDNCDNAQFSKIDSDSTKETVIKQVTEQAVKQMDEKQTEEADVVIDKTIQTTVQIKKELDLEFDTDSSATVLAEDIANLQINSDAINQTDKSQQTEYHYNTGEKPSQVNNHSSHSNKIHNAYISTHQSSFKHGGQFPSNNNYKQPFKSHNPSGENQNGMTKPYDNKHYDKTYENKQSTGASTGYNHSRYTNQSSGKHYNYGNQTGYHQNNGYQYSSTSHHKPNYPRGGKFKSGYLLKVFPLILICLFI